MKTFLLFLILAISCFQYSNGQTCTNPTISTSGSTNFCNGDQVVLTANTGTDSWTKKTDFPGVGRSDAITFTIGNKGYLGLGRSFSFPFPYYSDFWAYDAGTDTWTQQADFPGGNRVNPIGFSAGGKGYIGTGRIYSTNTYLKDFWEFDPATNTWIQKGDFGGGARYASAAFSIGNKGYICGGVDQADVYFNDLWEYDSNTDQWIQKASVGTTGRGASAAFSIADKGYVGMGSVVNGGNFSTALKDFWEYTPATDSWTQKADFLGTNYYYANACFSIGDMGYVSDLDFPKKDLWQYDPAFDAWTLKKSFAGASRLSAVGFSINGKGYLGTGRSSSGELKDFWEYKPEDTFTYHWSTGETTPSIVVKASGSFSVTVSNSLGCIATSASTNVTVGTPFPAPMILADGPTTFCEGRSVTLSVNHFWDNDPAGTTGLDYTYLWSTGETTQSIIVSNAGIYTLQVTNSTGCNQVTDPVEVTVTSIPIPHIIPDQLTVVFCEGGSVDFTAIPGTTDSGIRYLWSNGDTTQTISIGISGALYVTTTDSNGCSATSNVPLYVYAYPKPEIVRIHSVSPDCSGQNNGVIAISGSGFSGDFFYTIDNFATVNSSEYFDNLAPGTYLVGIQDIRYGCRSAIQSVVLSPSANSPLEIVCTPPLVVTTSKGCGSVNVEVPSPSATGGCSPITITSSHQGTSFPVGTTIITWEVKDASGQTATCQQLITVADQTPPRLNCPPDIIVQPKSLTGSLVEFSRPDVKDNCPGTTLTQIEGPSSGSLFPIGVTKVSFRARDAAGNTTVCSFQVKVLNPYCTGEGNNGKVYVCHNGQTICVKINALEAHLRHGDKLGQCGNEYTKPKTSLEFRGITVFPNPTKGKFTVQLNEIPASDGSLQILDAKGSIIENRTVKKAGFSSTISVDLGDKARGLFIVRFINSNDVYTTKIIVE